MRYRIQLLELDTHTRTYDVICVSKVDACYPGDALKSTIHYTDAWSIMESGPSTIATSPDKVNRLAVMAVR